MLYCDICRVRLVSNGLETYCPKCGLVLDRLWTKPQAEIFSREMLPPRPVWQLNIRQTQQNFGWRNGRIRQLSRGMKA